MTSYDASQDTAAQNGFERLLQHAGEHASAQPEWMIFLFNWPFFKRLQEPPPPREVEAMKQQRDLREKASRKVSTETPLGAMRRHVEGVRAYRALRFCRNVAGLGSMSMFDDGGALGFGWDCG